MKPILTPEKEAAIVRALRATNPMTRIMIARELNVQKNVVYAVALKHGIPAPRKGSISS